MKDDRPTCGVPEVARMTGYSRKIIRDAIRDGQIKAVYIGKQPRVPRVVLEQLLAGK
jgi:excisionase family DNA binding protein